MAMDIDQLRRGLRNIRTRSATINAALDGGEACVEAAIQLLNDRDEGTRWSAIRILAEIGNARTVAPLIALLDCGKNVTETANALRSITGQDFGEDAEAWRRWAREKPELGASATPDILSEEELLAAATRDLPVTVSGGEQQYAVDVSLSGGRSQQIWVDFSQTDPSGQPLVQLCTPCGDADEKRYEWALKLNMSMPYGAVALALLDETLCFAMVNTHLRATVHPEEIAKSIMTLAREGDNIEKALTDKDRY